MQLKTTIIAALVALSAVSANAITATRGGDTNAADFLTLSSANVSGGAIYAAGTSVHGTATTPAYAVGSYLAGNPSGTAVLNLGSSVSAVSFDWGTPDAYNTLIVTEANGTIKSFLASALGLSSEGYVTFKADAGTTLTSLTFKSSGYSFEAANFAVTAVPEPASLALLMAGLGAIGFMARKRRV